MYLLQVTAQPAAECSILSKEGENTWQDWHHRFGHIGVSGLQHTIDGQMVTGMVVNKSDSPKFDCEACIQAKQTHAPFPRQSKSRAERSGDLTHTDLWECRTTGIHGARYFISFIDDHSRCIALEFLKTKDQAAENFRNYVAYLEHQYNLFPKWFRADNGGEYITGDLQRWCAAKGIRLEYTAPYSPAQNGVAEQMNCTLVELTQAMILSTKTPKFLWPEAIAHATYLRNWTHTRALDVKTLLEAWCGQQLDVSHLQEFRSLVWILTEGQLSKMQP